MLSLAIPRLALAQLSLETCGPLTIEGLHDYRAPKDNYVRQVESAHFPIHVEKWIRGNRGYLGQDIDYTLQRIPNHHRALVSITTYSERVKKDQLPNMQYPVECYFERAIRFVPNDYIARMLYAQFLIGKARPAEAAKQLEQVSRMASDNPFTTYNIGLIYFDMKDYAQALTYAHKAMASGFTRPELRQQLESAGKWAEPVAEGVSSPSDSAAPAQSPVPAASAAVPQNN